MRYENEVLINYRIGKNSIIFWCCGIDKNSSVASVLNKFLCDFSKEKKIFFHGYRLPEEHIHKMIDTKVILDKSKIINDSFNVFFNLITAKVDISYFDYACEATVYYFDYKVEWTDFLATSIINQPEKYITRGSLLAYFASVDQGADFWFECSKYYEEDILALLHDLSALGCNLKHVSRLSFPYN